MVVDPDGRRESDFGKVALAHRNGGKGGGGVGENQNPLPQRVGHVAAAQILYNEGDLIVSGVRLNVIGLPLC